MSKLKVCRLFLLFSLFSPSLFAEYQTAQSHGLDIYYRVFGEGQPLLICMRIVKQTDNGDGDN